MESEVHSTTSLQKGATRTLRMVKVQVFLDMVKLYFQLSQLAIEVQDTVQM